MLTDAVNLLHFMLEGHLLSRHFEMSVISLLSLAVSSEISCFDWLPTAHFGSYSESS